MSQDEERKRCPECGHYSDTDHSEGRHSGHYGWCAERVAS